MKPVHNVAGLAGAYVAGVLRDLFGIGSWLWPLVFAHFGISRFVPGIRLAWWRWVGIFLVWTCFLVWASHPWFFVAKTAGGGFAGFEISRLCTKYLRPAGSFILWLLMTLLAVQITFGVSWSVLLRRIRTLWLDLWNKYQARRERREKLKKAEPKKSENPQEKKSLLPDFLRPRPADDEPDEDVPAPEKPKKVKPKKKSILVNEEPEPRPEAVQKSGAQIPKGKLPDFPLMDFLIEPPAERATRDKSELDTMAVNLLACMNDFNIKGEMDNVTPGPVVTMFEFKPAPGIKVSKIASLSDDIALALKALAVRIEAPIPGKDAVGIEIPNQDRQTVYLRSVLESDKFKKSKSKLSLGLGEDIGGHSAVADLAKMPHLLVAGATGAGKSVCINSMLVSLLYKASPEDLKLLLVDPKRIELAVYQDLPHLVHPVVTDMAMAKSALEWAVHEMDQRYESMARLGVRNIAGYNDKLSSLGDKRSEDLQDLEPMPYLVIIIDELADLMMTQGKDVELSIVRLAQLARAAGIHIILATQRPSVDVVTGLIKANFPTRISFQVTSKHDSRTILDTIGAEKLLGRGDMLFKPGGGKLSRLHGAYVDEDEISKVVGFWKQHTPQSFDLDFSEWQNGSQSGNGGGFEGPGASDDPMYNEAVEFVLTQGKASISMLQRRFRIGFNRAARYIEQMEQDGMLGPQEGSKPRVVLGAKE